MVTLGMMSRGLGHTGRNVFRSATNPGAHVCIAGRAAHDACAARGWRKLAISVGGDIAGLLDAYFRLFLIAHLPMR